MIVAVTGGRMVWDRALVRRTLLRFENFNGKITELHEGGANGWDRLCREYAEDNGIDCVTHWANWKKYGKPGGCIRNGKLLDRAKLEWLIAGPGGPGTANMIKQAGERGIKIFHAQPLVPMRDMQSN